MASQGMNGKLPMSGLQFSEPSPISIRCCFLYVQVSSTPPHLKLTSNSNLYKFLWRVFVFEYLFVFSWLDTYDQPLKIASLVNRPLSRNAAEP